MVFQRTLLTGALIASPASAQVDPGATPGTGPLVAALTWVEGTLLGSLATTAAVIAVAMIGYGMLIGRVDWRRGATVVVGCFVLFSAREIAVALAGLARAVPAPAAAPDTAQPASNPAVAPLATPYDPYAGAAVPTG